MTEIDEIKVGVEVELTKLEDRTGTIWLHESDKSRA